MADNTIKLPEEEFKAILELRDAIRQNVEMTGRMNIQLHFLKKDIAEMEEELAIHLLKAEELNGEERRVTEEIVSKYGEGQLDFSSGTYIKSE